MKREAPSDREIAELIAPAFERLPAPDSRRLVAIEERLLERPRRHTFAWWWLAAALATGAASALWWVVSYDSGKGREELVPAVTPSVAPSEQSVRPSQPEGAESARKPGPVIYRREQ